MGLIICHTLGFWATICFYRCVFWVFEVVYWRFAYLYCFQGELWSFSGFEDGRFLNILSSKSSGSTLYLFKSLKLNSFSSSSFF